MPAITVKVSVVSNTSLLKDIILAFILSTVEQCMNSQSISFGSGAYSMYK